MSGRKSVSRFIHFHCQLILDCIKILENCFNQTICSFGKSLANLKMDARQIFAQKKTRKWFEIKEAIKLVEGTPDGDGGDDGVSICTPATCFVMTGMRIER
uniref:Uncharacterized protein n=1 Tax=Clytia hemisphaerica TaxID=252671 RepID=A0A7M5WHY9_9CNID